MNEDTFKHKFTAILTADVKGYSRLLGEDEEETVRTLNAHREMVFILIERNQGRLVNSTGDNLLVEFSSVVDAVRCAVQKQEDLREKNKEQSENRKMEFLIGINLGDIIQKGDRTFGDDVNVAARIESLEDGGANPETTMQEIIQLVSNDTEWEMASNRSRCAPFMKNVSKMDFSMC